MKSPALPSAFLKRPLAHRGLHDSALRRPENSRAAAVAAVNEGYGIECDVQLSKDGVAMVFHDSSVERMTGQPGLISQRDSIDLGTMRLRDGDEGIPTLSQFLDVLAGRAALLIEIKDQTGVLGPGPDTLERAVATALQDYDGPVAVMSFNPHVIRSFGRIAPDIPRGRVTEGFNISDWPHLQEEDLATLRSLSDLDDLAFISHAHHDLHRNEVRAFRADGKPVLCWTIRSATEEFAARELADNITFEGYSA